MYTKRLWLIYAYAFFRDFSFFTAVLVPFFTEWGGISLFQIQLIQSWFSFWVFILEVPTGAVADRIGRKYSIALGSLIVGLAVLLYGSIPRFEIFLLSEFLFAIGFAFSSGADEALLYDTLREEGREGESKRILGRANALHLLGMLVAAPMGSIIAGRFGINAPMLYSSVPFFIASIIGWTIAEPKIHTTRSESPQYLDIVKRGFFQLRTNTALRALAIDSVLVSASAYFVVWFYQPLLTRTGVPIYYFGFAHALLLGTQILVSSHFPFLESLVGTEKRYLRISALLTALSFIGVSLYPQVLPIILFIVLAGGIGLTRGSYISIIANKYIVSHERATVLSSVAMLRRFSLIILNPFVGLIADSSLPLALFLVGLLPLGTFLVSLEKKERKT